MKKTLIVIATILLSAGVAIACTLSAMGPGYQVATCAAINSVTNSTAFTLQNEQVSSEMECTFGRVGNGVINATIQQADSGGVFTNATTTLAIANAASPSDDSMKADVVAHLHKKMRLHILSGADAANTVSATCTWKTR